MSKSTTVQPRKRGPKPSGIGTPVQVRLQPDMLKALDDWRREQPNIPSRPEAIREAVKDWLTGMGLMKP